MRVNKTGGGGREEGTRLGGGGTFEHRGQFGREVIGGSGTTLLQNFPFLERFFRGAMPVEVSGQGEIDAPK